MGDQECNEGTVWESLLLINHHNINNITIIIDRNFSREDHLKLGDLKLKLRDFSELIIDIDGHNLKEIEKSIKLKNPPDQPKIIIAKTIKAHGSIIMENDNSWHHRHPITRKELVELQKSIKKGPVNYYRAFKFIYVLNLIKMQKSHQFQCVLIH